jgi:prepilin peptidase CpaA
MKLLATSLPHYSVIIGLVITVFGAAWTDLRQFRIPNQLLAASAVAALMLSVYLSGGHGLIASLVGGLIGGMVFLPLYLLRGMAAGDVKLMAVIGLYAGAALTLDIALLTALIGGIWIMVLFQWEMQDYTQRLKQFGLCLRHRHLRSVESAKKAAPQNKSLLIPYGAVIAVGTVLALIIASQQR